MQPIIVIGPPRSGTSVIARLLQEKCGVMVDEGPIRKDRHNPKGYYEDQRLIDITQRGIARWKIGGEGKISMAWATEFVDWVSYRKHKYKSWGFKDPSCVGMTQWIVQILPEATWIVCRRRTSQIVKSQVKKLGIPLEFSKASIKATYRIVEKYIQEKHFIDLSARRKESELVTELRMIVNG